MSNVTPRIAATIASEEGVVLEAYKDSVGVWTWGVGVTNASGHKVGRYKDNPQTLDRVMEVFIWLLEEKYAPAVKRAFKGVELTEEQFGAALSFHYNTGAISRATWVDHFVKGDSEKAYESIMNWTRAGNNPDALRKRRTRERNLFFEGKWPVDSKVMVYPVRKPSYRPNFSKGKVVDVLKSNSPEKKSGFFIRLKNLFWGTDND